MSKDLVVLRKREEGKVLAFTLTKCNDEYHSNCGIQDGREGPYESYIDRSYHYRLISAKVKRPLCSISSILWKCLLSSLFTGNGWKISKFQGT